MPVHVYIKKNVNVILFLKIINICNDFKLRKRINSKFMLLIIDIASLSERSIVFNDGLANMTNG